MAFMQNQGTASQIQKKKRTVKPNKHSHIIGQKPKKKKDQG
jgi:hypothetical protein